MNVNPIAAARRAVSTQGAVEQGNNSTVTRSSNSKAVSTQGAVGQRNTSISCIPCNAGPSAGNGQASEGQVASNVVA